MNGRGNVIRIPFRLSAHVDNRISKVFESPFAKDEVHLSYDGRWVAFNSDDSGRTEVYVASFPAFTDKRQVSNAGGGVAFWRKDGKELFYLGPDGKLMSVDIKTGATLETGAPKVLFQTKIAVVLGVDQYAPASDGQKFLLIEPLVSASITPHHRRTQLDCRPSRWEVSTNPHCNRCDGLSFQKGPAHHGKGQKTSRRYRTHQPIMASRTRMVLISR